MTPKRERRKKQHLQAFGKVGIDRCSDVPKPMLAKVSRHQSEMIGAAIRTDLRRKRVDKIIGSVADRNDTEKELPAMRIVGQRNALFFSNAEGRHNHHEPGCEKD